MTIKSNSIWPLDNEILNQVAHVQYQYVSNGLLKLTC